MNDFSRRSFFAIITGAPVALALPTVAKSHRVCPLSKSNGCEHCKQMFAAMNRLWEVDKKLGWDDGFPDWVRSTPEVRRVDEALRGWDACEITDACDALRIMHLKLLSS